MTLPYMNRSSSLVMAAALMTGPWLGACSTSTTTPPVTGGAPDLGVVTSAVTFHKDVEPILQKHCQDCHSDGHIAPFSLLTYEQTKGVAQAILGDVTARIMPPWGAFETSSCKPRHAWRDDRRLADAEIATVTAWVKGGTPEGNLSDAPPPRTPAPVDLPGKQQEVQPDKPYVTGGTADHFRCFVMDPKFTAPKFLNGWNVVPGNPKVVHHALLFADAKGAAKKLADADGGYDCFGGPGVDADLLAAWAPGAAPIELAQGVATTLQPGTVFVMQIHYHPNGLANQSDSTRFQMRFQDAAPDWTMVTALIGNFDSYDPTTGDGLQPDANGKAQFTIPANAKDYPIDMKWTVPQTVGGSPLPTLYVYGVGTHMHYVGRDMSVQLVHTQAPPGDGASECLLETPTWNFNWQGAYLYDAPVEQLPKIVAGDVLKLHCSYDNTLGNGFVAAALRDQGRTVPSDVSLGETTLDEMCLVLLQVVYKSK